MPMTNSKTIKVQFPNGERLVPAYVKLKEAYHGAGGFAAITRHAVLTPEPMDGWLFMQEIDGTWKAYKDH
jgi:hypothetical protein